MALKSSVSLISDREKIMTLIELMRKGRLYETSIIVMKQSRSFRERFGNKDYGTSYVRIPKKLHSLFDDKTFNITKATPQIIEYTEAENGEYNIVKKGYNKSSRYIRLPIKIEQRRAVIEILNEEPLVFRVHIL